MSGILADWGEENELRSFGETTSSGFRFLVDCEYMGEANRSFTELELWKKARELKNDIYRLAKGFPVEEKYRLTDQLIRSSRGINAAIAEGHGRFTFKDQARFCIIARGSLSETLNHLLDAADSSCISHDDLVKLKTRIDEVGRLLNGYMNFLRKNIESK